MTAQDYLSHQWVHGAAISWDPRTRLWTLTAAYTFDTTMGRIIAPEGFAFDLASIPRVVWWWVAPHELSVEAALLHDLLYARTGVPLPGECLPHRTFTRAEADVLFYEEMEKRGTPTRKRRLAYWAVKVFGWTAWNRHKRRHT